MRIGFEPDYDLDKEIEKFKELLTLQKQLFENTKLLRFIGIREMAELTGWSLPTVKIFTIDLIFLAVILAKRKWPR